MADEEAVAVCMPVNKLDPSCIVVGSMKKPCSGCNQEVWISPVTLAKTTRILCIPCVVAKNPKNEDFCIHPEQIREIQSHIRQQQSSESAN